MTDNELYFGGFKLRETNIPVTEIEEMNVDVAIFVANWEDRASLLAQSGKFSGKHCIIADFDDSDLPEETVENLTADAKKTFDTVDFKTLRSPREYSEVMSDAEVLAKEIAGHSPLTCFVDYSSLPKIVTQTLFRQFMLEGLCPIVNWAYLTGLYDNTPTKDEEFHQGVRKFFAIRGAEGGGGMSTKRVGIIALGADRPLIDAYLRNRNHDEILFVHAHSESSPELMKKIEEQIRWIQFEHGYDRDAFIQSSATTALDALKIFSEICDRYPEESGASIELFCAGPKSHAIAASALVTNLNHVRLVGRTPNDYAKFNVKAAGDLSITTVEDFTNPKIARALVRKASSI